MRRGLTLIELLVSIVIISVAIGIIFGVVVNIVRSKDRVSSLAKGRTTLLLILDEMKKEFESVYFCPKYCGVVIEERGYFGRPYDRIVFTTYYGGEHKVIEYFVLPDEKTGTGRMMKRISNTLEEDLDKGGIPIKILDNVSFFDVKAFDGKTFQERWGKENFLPEFIEVRVGLWEPKEKKEYSKDEEVSFQIFIERRAETPARTTGIYTIQ